jgi:hypothetical protein
VLHWKLSSLLEWNETLVRKLIYAVKQFSWRRKLIIGILLIVVVATWLAVCFVLASYWLF